MRLDDQKPVGYVQVVDLPALMRHNRYQAVHTVQESPRSVSLAGWNADKHELVRDEDGTRLLVTIQK